MNSSATVERLVASAINCPTIILSNMTAAFRQVLNNHNLFTVLHDRFIPTAWCASFVLGSKVSFKLCTFKILPSLKAPIIYERVALRISQPAACMHVWAMSKLKKKQRGDNVTEYALITKTLLTMDESTEVTLKSKFNNAYFTAKEK